MRAVVAAIIALVILYAADREFADGRYAQAAFNVISQIRRSMGF